MDKRLLLSEGIGFIFRKGFQLEVVPCDNGQGRTGDEVYPVAGVVPCVAEHEPGLKLQDAGERPLLEASDSEIGDVGRLS